MSTQRGGRNMEQDLTYQEKIELLEKEIDALEMSIKALQLDLKSNFIEKETLKQELAKKDATIEKFEEENQRLIDNLFSQARMMNDIRKQYKKTIAPRKKTFTEWLFGKWQ